MKESYNFTPFILRKYVFILNIYAYMIIYNHIYFNKITHTHYLEEHRDLMLWLLKQQIKADEHLSCDFI